MNRTRTVLTALPLLSVLALGACSGDDPQPKVAPPSSSAPTSPSTTPASVTDAPTMPAAAEALDQSGAKQFVKYWFGALSYAMSSGDTTAVTRASEPGCRSCRALIKKIDDLYAKGGRVDSDGWAVEESVVNGSFVATAPSFLLRVRQAKRTLYDGNKLVDETPAAKVPMHIELSSSSGVWLVTSLEILA